MGRPQGNTPYKPLKPLELIGKPTTGDLYEQPVEACAEQNGGGSVRRWLFFPLYGNGSQWLD